VDDTGAEVTSRVDRVTGGATEGQADADDHEGGGHRAERAEAVALVVQTLGEDRQDQDHGGDDLGGEVLRGVPDLGRRGEDAEHRAGLAGLLRRQRLVRHSGVLSAGAADELTVGEVGLELPVVRDPHERGADHRAEHLRQQVERYVAPRSAALDGQADGDRRVEVSAGDAAREVGSGQHREAPPESDGDPAGVLRLGALECDSGAHATAEEDEYGGTYGLADEDVGAGHPRLLCPSSRGRRTTRVPPVVRALRLRALARSALRHPTLHYR
jgi:hypothetical protein